MKKHFGAWTLKDHINIMDTVREYGQIVNNEFEAGLICQVFDLDVAKEIEKKFGL